MQEAERIQKMGACSQDFVSFLIPIWRKPYSEKKRSGISPLSSGSCIVPV